MANVLGRLIPQIVGDYPKSFTTLFNKISISTSTSEDEIRLILWKAFEFGKSCHSGQKRLSGKPYFSDHCVSVANILADWKMDHNTIIGGLLHDTVEDSDISIDQIKKQFGDDVAQMVDGVTKLGHLEFTNRQEKQAGNFMKLLLSVAQDLRVVMIKFADRLHNMKTLHYMSRLKQHRIAKETRDVYVPLAHRLGMASVKWELEDMVMATLHPKKHKEIKAKLKATKRQREKVINQVITPIQCELKDFDLNAEIFGRPKSIFSIFGKMITRNKTFEEIFDLYAIRVLVDELEQCYLILGVIHQLYSPVQERFKDFIATPKSNGYQSIHTTVIGPNGNMVEIQIRTQKMDETAEIGVAAHWRYKEGKNTSTDLGGNVKWLRELIDILQSETADPNEFMHLLKIDLFDDEIFVFTPKGDLVQLPNNSTVIDFAFQIHTQVGLHCLGSKINHKVVPLNTVLKNGDRVEILTSSTQKPSYGWLKFVVTSKARTHINRYLKSIRRDECIHIGKEILEKSLRRNKLGSLSNTYSEEARQLILSLNNKIRVLEIDGRQAKDDAEKEDVSGIFAELMTDVDVVESGLTTGTRKRTHEEVLALRERLEVYGNPTYIAAFDKLSSVERWKETDPNVFNRLISDIGDGKYESLDDVLDAMMELSINPDDWKAALTYYNAFDEDIKRGKMPIYQTNQTYKDLMKINSRSIL